MTAMTLLLLGGALCMGFSAALVFVLAARSGQFDDLEDTKYQLLRDDDDQDC